MGFQILHWHSPLPTGVHHKTGKDFSYTFATSPVDDVRLVLGVNKPELSDSYALSYTHEEAICIIH